MWRAERGYPFETFLVIVRFGALWRVQKYRSTKFPRGGGAWVYLAPSLYVFVWKLHGVFLSPSPIFCNFSVWCILLKYISFTASLLYDCSWHKILIYHYDLRVFIWTVWTVCGIMYVCIDCNCAREAHASTHNTSHRIQSYAYLKYFYYIL